MDLESIFGYAKAVHQLGSPVTFSESFLSFASYAEQDDSLYPYWRMFNEEDKFTFIDFCFTKGNDYVFCDYIARHKECFWAYMSENSEISLPGRKGWFNTYYTLENFRSYYIPKFTVCSIAFLGGLKLRFSDDEGDKESFIRSIVRCDNSKNYFNLVFDHFEGHLNKSSAICFEMSVGEINIDILSCLRKTIMQKISELSN